MTRQITRYSVEGYNDTTHQMERITATDFTKKQNAVSYARGWLLKGIPGTAIVVVYSEREGVVREILRLGLTRGGRVERLLRGQE